MKKFLTILSITSVLFFSNFNSQPITTKMYSAIEISPNNEANPPS